MTRIGLISDTHSCFDDDMRTFLANVDQVWHAGDIGSIETFMALKDFKPLVAVWGNIDNNVTRSEVVEYQLFTVEGVKVLMTHIGGYPNHYVAKFKGLIQTEKPQIFVSGHSHILRVMFDKQLNCLHMNPGAAGIFGFHNKRTMLRFVIDGSEIKDLEVWEKPKKTKI